MILYSNGCSYTANLVVDSNKRYPQKLADTIGAELVEAGIPGSCNDRIIRCTIRDCIGLLNQGYSDILAMVQLTHLHRFEVSGIPTVDTQWKYAPGDFYESVKPYDPTDPEYDKIREEYVKYNTDLSLFDKLCAGIVGLCSFFETNGINYLIYAGPCLLASADQDLAKQQNIYQWLRQNPRVLDLVDFNMLAVAKTHKHPTPDEYSVISDYFFQLLTISNLADQGN